jgi:hypothetical protein
MREEPIFPPLVRTTTAQHARWSIVTAAIVALLAASALAPLGASAGPCTGQGVELQVLGSGGPELEDKRASSSYLAGC